MRKSNVLWTVGQLPVWSLRFFQRLPWDNVGLLAQGGEGVAAGGLYVGGIGVVEVA